MLAGDLLSSNSFHQLDNIGAAQHAAPALARRCRQSQQQWRSGCKLPIHRVHRRTFVRSSRILSIVASFVLPDASDPVAQLQAQLVINVPRLVLTECPRLQGATVINVAPRVFDIPPLSVVRMHALQGDGTVVTGELTNGNTRHAAPDLYIPKAAYLINKPKLPYRRQTSRRDASWLSLRLRYTTLRRSLFSSSRCRNGRCSERAVDVAVPR